MRVVGVHQGSARQTLEDGIAHAKLQAEVQGGLLTLQRDLLAHMREGSWETHKRYLSRHVSPKPTRSHGCLAEPGGRSPHQPSIQWTEFAVMHRDHLLHASVHHAGPNPPGDGFTDATMRAMCHRLSLKA